MRADQLLVERQLASSRSQAQRLIAAGVQWRLGAGAWQSVRKNGDDVPLSAELQLQDQAEARYVSRGGLKLEGALQATGLQVAGWHCLDVGQSTGGFTDCLLQHGVAQVVGLDVGQGQIHPKLREDARVQVHEKVNARDAQAVAEVLGAVPHPNPSPQGEGLAVGSPRPLAGEGLGVRAANLPGEGLTVSSPLPQAGEGSGVRAADLLVGDVSFISLTLVLPTLVPYVRLGGHVLMLVKPQFELQPQQIGKGGIVRDAGLYAEVERKLRACCQSLQLQVLHWLPSPIEGGDGNREFFIHAQKA